ncbi:MAG: protein kinase [Planctomycetaceae bacterium]
MFELVATSRELRKQRRLTLNKGDVVRIGRRPENGWAVPWDSTISREHVELIVKHGKIVVRQLEQAHNGVHFKGKTVRKFTAAEGEPFRIGVTTFRMEKVSELRNRYGQHFAGHKVQSDMGQGPLGDLIGVNAPTGESIVMKIISPHLLPESDSVENCLQRAQNFCSHRMTGIGAVYDAGNESGRLWMTREFVPGSSLQDVLRKRSMPRQKSFETVEQIARNLASLHAAGLCHLNLKPTNIIYRAGATKLVDASPAGSLYPLAASGKINTGIDGIIHYLAPEIAESIDAADIRSDLYALGCLWFEMLTGSPPYPHGSPEVRVKSHAKIEPDWQQPVQAGMLEDELSVLRQLLSKKPNNRFDSPAALLEKLHGSDLKGSFVDCIACNKRYRITPALTGRKVRCKECGETISIPERL